MFVFYILFIFHASSFLNRQPKVACGSYKHTENNTNKDLHEKRKAGDIKDTFLRETLNNADSKQIFYW